jgi:hypothetical protein
MSETLLRPTIYPCRPATRIFAKRRLKLREVGQRHQPCLAEARHVGAQVIDPHRLGIGLVGLSTGQEDDVGLHALSIEDASRQAQNGVQVAQLHHPLTKTPASVVLEQHVVRQDDGGATAGLQRPHHMLDESQLLVGGIDRDRKILPARSSSPLFGAEGRIGQDQIGLTQGLTVR